MNYKPNQKVMKKLSFFIVVLTFFGLNEATGQWTTSGNNIYNTNSENVGIGTNSPGYLLHVSKNMTSPSVRIQNSGGIGGASFDMVDSFSGANWKFKATNPGGFKIRDHANGLDVFMVEPNSAANALYIKSGGNVGIGTTTPIMKLQVASDDSAVLLLENTQPLGTDVSTAMYFKTGNGGVPYTGAIKTIGEGTIYARLGLFTYAAPTPDGLLERLSIDDDGNVGIGTITPEFRLDIWGDNTDQGSGLRLANSDLSHFLAFWGGRENDPNPYILWKSGDPLRFATDEGGWSEKARFNNNGQFGVGTYWWDTLARFHVRHSEYETCAIFGTSNLETSDIGGTIVNIGNPGDDSKLFIGPWAYNRGYIIWDQDSDPNDGIFKIGTSYGANNLALCPDGGRVGINTTDPGSLLHVYQNIDEQVHLGYGPGLVSYVHHKEDPVDGVGQASQYAKRSRTSSSPGTGYELWECNSAIKGYNVWGDNFTFGITGHCDNDFPRSGGVLGGYSNLPIWGALGYHSSGGTSYGGYFTSYVAGTGKDKQSAHIGIGVEAWGDLFGADIHGEVYGLYAEGGNYAMYSDGPVYKNDVDVHLQDNGSGDNTVLYTNVSTHVSVQTSGVATLSSGRTTISFDKAFTAIVSQDEPVIVTVTPMGETNGVYLSEITTSGFTVIENNEGKSNVTVNYIAIGKRAGYEDPQLAPEVIARDYTDKLARGLHNDNDLETDGEGLYFEDGKLTVGIHPSTLPDPNKTEVDPGRHKPSASQKE